MVKFIIIAIFASIVAGMGIGGGSIFILLSTILGVLSQRQAQAYNLIMFIVVGLGSSLLNLKNKTIDKKLFLELIVPTCIGSLLGISLMKILEENTLRNLFYAFMLIIGFYEIFSSLKNIKNVKNNNVERR